MRHVTAVIRFPDGHRLYGAYDTLGESVATILFATPSAVNNFVCGASRLMEYGEDEETVEVLPYALDGDETVAFVSKACRGSAVLTGVRSRDGSGALDSNWRRVNE